MRGDTRIAVAFSGGRDSSALLHAACVCAARMGVEIHALHIDHGLSVRAQEWSLHCERQCQAWSVLGARLILHVRALALQPVRGESLEAIARKARYSALADMAREAGCGTVLLAHHRDDQVETFLLQALRGAGPAGLSAMPVHVLRHGIQWVRPWLDQPREAIEAYVDAHALAFVDDDSNVDRRHPRNRLRLSVLPALRKSFPDADVVLAAATRHAQDAQVCLDALAQVDHDVAAADEALHVPTLLALGPARVRNLLRHWIQQRSGRRPVATLLERLSIELTHASDGSWPHADGCLCVYRQRLDWQRTSLASAVADEFATALPSVVEIEIKLGCNVVPQWAGVLWVDPIIDGGIALADLTHLTLRPRCGGEQFQAHRSGLPRALKKQYQAAALPSWKRRGPLVFAAERLVFVPGLGLDARCLAQPGVTQVRLRWQSDDAPEMLPDQVSLGSVPVRG